MWKVAFGTLVIFVDTVKGSENVLSGDESPATEAEGIALVVRFAQADNPEICTRRQSWDFANIKAGRNHSNLLCRKSQVKMCQGKNGQKWICLLHCIGGVVVIGYEV